MNNFLKSLFVLSILFFTGVKSFAGDMSAFDQGQEAELLALINNLNGTDEGKAIHIRVNFSNDNLAESLSQWQLVEYEDGNPEDGDTLTFPDILLYDANNPDTYNLTQYLPTIGGPYDILIAHSPESMVTSLGNCLFEFDYVFQADLSGFLSGTATTDFIYTAVNTTPDETVLLYSWSEENANLTADQEWDYSGTWMYSEGSSDNGVFTFGSSIRYDNLYQPLSPPATYPLCSSLSFPIPSDSLDCNDNDFSGLGNLIGDGFCNDGSEGFNFNCYEFDFDANDCSLNYEDLFGCTSTCAPNYSVTNFYDDGSCEFYEGCNFPYSGPASIYEYQYINIDTCAIHNVDLCIPTVYGCTDPNYIEYDPLANSEDYGYPIEFCENLIGCPGSNNIFVEVTGTDDSTNNVYSWQLSNQFYEIPEDAETFYGGNNEIGIYNYCLSDGCYRLDMNSTWDNGNIIVRLDSNIILNEIMDDGANLEIHYFGLNVISENCVDSSIVLGCTYSDAENYNSLATQNNGTCEYILGCMDEDAFNYNPEATQSDGSCVDYLWGCTDSNYLEFNPEANMDVGCVYPNDCDGYESVYVQVSNYENSSTGLVWSVDIEGDNINDFDGSLGDTSLFCMVSGTCMLLNLYEPNNSNSNNPVWSNATASVVHADGTVLLSEVDFNGTEETFSVCYGEFEDGGLGGCTFSYASNYNPLATFNNGTCEYYDCQGQDYTEYADIWIGDGYCDDGTWTLFFNCEYFNYDEGDCETPNELGLELKGILDLDLGSSNGKAIQLKVHGEIPDLSIYSIGVANNGGGSDGEEYYLPGISASDGDDILLARNTQAMSVYFGSCIDKFEHLIQVGGAIDQNGDDAIELYKNGLVIETFGDVDVDGTGTSWEYQDSWAFKEDVWTFGGVNCSDNIESNDNAPCPYPICEVPIAGCTDPLATNYNSDANIDNGTCILNTVIGCMNLNALNYDPEATVNSGCILPIYGCLDTIALNYDTLANTPDGSCDYIDGCTNQLAPNYDPTATQDDGTCAFFYIDDVDSISACGSILYDSGGPDGNYLDYENHTITIFPENQGEYVSISFSSFQLEDCCDYLTIYDGEGSAYPTPILQDGSNGSSLNGKTFYASPTNESGALTITFTSDGSVTYSGFSAEISCITYDGPGCTNLNASNYNPQAGTDDGSCIFDDCDNYNCFDDEYNLSNTLVAYGYMFSSPGCQQLAEMTGYLNDPAIAVLCCETFSNYEGFDVQTYGTECLGESCLDNEFTCNNGQCIDMSLFNNGTELCGTPNNFYAPDCSDGSDEPCIDQASDLYGCMDPSATNYNSEVTIDNGNCDYPSYGCMDPYAMNYSSGATANFNCQYQPAGGTCSMQMINEIVYGVYNCLGDCIFPDTNSDGIDDIPLSQIIAGCEDLYDPGCTYHEGLNYDVPDQGWWGWSDDGSCTFIRHGCTNPVSVNYNPNANYDNGSCLIPVVNIFGCTNPSADNYNSSANVDDGTCDISGCTDPFAENYNSSANVDDGSCDISGCTTDWAQNYNPEATVDDGSCEFIYGCLDFSATNYNPDANYNDGSCYYYSDEVGSPCTILISEQVYITVSIPYPPFSVEEPVFGAFQDVEYSGAYDCDLNCWYDQSTIESSGEFSCLGEIIIGCNNPLASNYNPSANVIINDDCVISGCSDINALNYNSDATEDDGSCQYVDGCIDDIALNYNPEATQDDGSCQYIEGCMDDDALNYNPDATQGDGSCQYVEGCMDPSFVNYNPEALIDDGSCSNDILGCTYSWASNYNSDATQDDGSCDQPTSSGGGDCPEVQMLDIPLNLPQGWSMFGYTCHESLNLLDAFFTISDKITIVKDANGAAYLPEFQFSAIQSLNFSQGYQIKMIETVNDFQFCPSVILND